MDCLTGCHPCTMAQWMSHILSSLFYHLRYNCSFFYIEDVVIFMNKFKQLLISTPILFSMFFPLLAFAAPAQVDSGSDAEMRKMILYYVNAHRAKHHLSPLSLNEDVSKEAAKHSRAMASKSIPFGHAYFNDRIHRVYQQVKNCNGGAENVAYYRLNAKRLVDAWIASPGHRRNIEGHYNVTGIGIAHGKTGWAYYTQIFVKKEDKAFV